MKYPWVGMNKVGGVVLFTEKGQGVVLRERTDNRIPWHKFGEYGEFSESIFNPIDFEFTFSEKACVKSPVDIVQALIENGYKVDEHGDWIHKNKCKNTFTSTMWQYAEKELNSQAEVYDWEPEWLENKNT